MGGLKGRSQDGEVTERETSFSAIEIRDAPKDAILQKFALQEFCEGRERYAGGVPGVREKTSGWRERGPAFDANKILLFTPVSL